LGGLLVGDWDVFIEGMGY